MIKIIIMHVQKLYFWKNCTNFYTKIKLYLVPRTFVIFFANKKQGILFSVLIFNAVTAYWKCNMVFNNGDKAFIKNVHQSKNATFRGYWQNFWRQTATKKTRHVIKKIRQTQTTDQEHKSDRLTHAHNEENVTTVKELVAPLRQEGQKQTHRSTSQISKETDLTQCSIVQIIRCVFFCLGCFSFTKHACWLILLVFCTFIFHKVV